MDTKANTVLIGAFTLAVLALGFVFVYWLARSSGQGESLPLTIVFNDSVTGLSTGSQVVFNGIKVGDVKSLQLDPQDPKRVVATTSIQTNTPIKDDTQVTLGFQGLTGVGYVELVGGSPDKPPIWEVEDPAVIVAQRSSMQDLLAGAREIMARADSTMASVEKVVSENTDDINRAVQNVQQFTQALAANSDEVKNLVEQAATASAAIAGISDRLQGIVEKGEALVGAVNPDDVREAVANTRKVTEQLAQRAEDLQTIITRGEAISGDIQGFTTRLPELGERVDSLIAAIDPEAINATFTKLGTISEAIDPEQVRTAVDGVASLAQTLQARQADIDLVVSKAAGIASNLDSFATNLPDFGTRANSLIAAIDPDTLGQTIGRIGEIAASIEPERIRTTVDGFADISDALSGHSDEIDQIVTRLAVISTNVESFSTSLPQAGEKAGQILAAIDPQKFGQSLDNINTFTTALAENSDEVEAIVADVKRVSARFDTLTVRADSLLAKLDDMAGSGTGGLVADAQATLAAVRAAANTFNAQAATVGSGTDRSLRGLQGLVSEGQAAVNRLDGVISNLERNPGGFIFGGENVPEYNGRRR